MCVLMVHHANTHTHTRGRRKRGSSVPAHPKLGITATQLIKIKNKNGREEIHLFRNGRAPSWMSAALDHLHDAGCRTVTSSCFSKPNLTSGESRDFVQILNVLTSVHICSFNLYQGVLWKEKKNPFEREHVREIAIYSITILNNDPIFKKKGNIDLIYLKHLSHC